jgi:hypothetical protein
MAKLRKLRKRKRTRHGRSRYLDAVTPEGQSAQREAAFAAIRKLYCESLPLWRTCAQGYCRRHHTCGGDGHTCLTRAWPLMSKEVQERAFALVMRGGPQRIRAATRREQVLRGYPPSNFVH